MFEKIISSWSNLFRFIILSGFIGGSIAWLILNTPELIDSAIEIWHRLK